ncbi:Type III pantothenate kinase [Candidatus Nitrotoga sp. HW29]|uniref:type III pantothenate kinase n=1 Tax=Candidatus Nitrotoga sp. HW29 TaxID=2886963 RepID=UPI001EF2C116|nr:type III pantothenate kinase [Candidatus Nitrotoga sp. HW29]CAH1904569.1 Type III pantothenate kinase [Candidatus Nitrotoga sp. HW29]
MKILLIDAGNSRVKWAMVEDGLWLQQNVLENTHVSALSVAFLKLPPPDRILISNVAGEKMTQLLFAACAAWQCPVEFIAAQVEQCGVRNLYEHPAQLGSDRWAALIAAWHQARVSCLVVNCGTATTVDALSTGGEFLGGLILPGIKMMQSNLAAGAAQLEQAEGTWHEFPRNTTDAIFSGSIQATIGAIHLQFEALAVRGDVRCLLSGGAADKVQSHLKLPLERVDNLVLRGLQIIAQESLS